MRRVADLWVGIPVLAWAILFVSTGFADVVPVANPSFEILPPGGLPNSCGPSCFFSVDPIPGWTNVVGNSGQFQPGTQDGNFTFFDSLSDGITTAYSNDIGGVISQTVGATVQAGVTYTLQADLGHEKNTLGQDFTASADLLIKGIAYPAVGVAPAPGSWGTFTATYIGLPQDVGDAITIELHSSGFQGNFDNVRLNDSLTTGAVPEPSTYILLITVAAIALWLIHRRRIGNPIS